MPAFVKSPADAAKATALQSVGRGLSVLFKASKPAKCPHCGSTDTGLLPPDFETAKCGACKKNFDAVKAMGKDWPRPDKGESMGKAQITLTRPARRSLWKRLFGKADVHEPGKRGGKGYYDKKGQWQYGPHPDPLTNAAHEAHATGAPSPHLTSSNMDMAHRVGLWLRERGHPLPYKVAPSRGYTFKVHTHGAPERTLSFRDGSDPVELTSEIAAKASPALAQLAKACRAIGPVRVESGKLVKAAK